jgi:hypothetical protein
MMALAIETKTVREVLFQFVFPFSLEHHCQNQLREKLLDDGFVPFRLGDTELEHRFYGHERRVSHREMERYYLPFTNQVLFPADDNPDAFRRLSKSLGIEAELVSRHGRAAFTIHSVDMFLCPFDTGFLTLRTELDTKKAVTFTDSIEFADRFRSLQDSNRLDRETFVEFKGRSYEEIDQFLFQEIVPQVLDFLDKTPMEGSYFEELPFLMDERMFVLAFYRFPEELEISVVDRYRAAHLDGIDVTGKPVISSSNLPYIRDYCRSYGYDRWAPHTYFFMDESCFCCLTREPQENSAIWVSRMYGEYYYGLMLNLFHRIVLLKLSNAYSHVQVERKEEHTVELIRDITTFSAKYNFVEVVAQSHGREIFHRLRQVYGNEELFNDVKQTLNDLYQYQESRRQHQSGYLLTILTIYTVISGIFGMNQVIEDLKTPIKWSVMGSYSPFQWIAFVVTISGLVVAFILVLNVIWKWTSDFIRRKTK